METNLTPQDEVILERLKLAMEKRLLTQEQVEFLRKAMLLQESFGIIGRFLVGLAGFILVVISLFKYLPFGVPK